MKKIIIVSLILWLFIGCASTQANRTLQLGNMCYEQNNQQACQTLLIESRVKCNNYDHEGCYVLVIIYGEAFDGQSIVGNISKAESYKNAIFYATKACMLGNVHACQELEQLKIQWEQMP